MAKDCRDTALSFLEHRARTAFEMKAHLFSKGFLEEKIEETLQYLQELGYVDDIGYCKDYIRRGINKGRGPVRIQSELSEKGIDAALIRSALEEDFDRQTEKEAALQEAYKLIKSKSDTGVPDESEPALKPDEKTIAKAGRKLSSQGYHTEVIYEILGRIMRSREPD